MLVVVGTAFAPNQIEVLICALVCAVPLLVRSRKRLQGSTLLAPWTWSCVALAALSFAIVFEGSGGARFEPRLVAHFYYLAAVSTLCPIVALLGAKRPQNRAWQWIVFSLLALLALPSLKAIVFDGGAEPDPHVAWRWLILIIALSGLANYLPTRYVFSAGLFFCGQTILLADYLPGAIWSRAADFKAFGSAFLSAAVVVAYLLARIPTFAAAPEDRLWVEFRNAFGALWALRVAERFNAVAAQNGWKVWLSWHGLEPAAPSSDGPARESVGDMLPPELRPAVHQALKSLLWRFVSAEWIAERLAAPQGE